MPSTTFVDKVTTINTAWLNDVNTLVWTVFNGATTPALARTALGLGSLATLSSVGTAQLTDDAVTYAKLQNISATSRFIGRITAGAGDAEELTPTQATSLLNAMVGDSGSGGTKGLVPAPSAGDATKFLRGDATWGTVSSDPTLSIIIGL